MITIALLSLPILAALFLFISRSAKAKQIALVVTIAEFVLAVVAAVQFEQNSSVQFLANYSWIPSLGIDFKVGMDGVSLLLVLLTAFLMPFIVHVSFKKKYDNEAAFYALLLLAQTGLIGVFTSLNGFLFYFFWEVVLIPVYFLAILWGGERRVAVTFKFFIYTVLGSFFMLLGFIYLYLQTPGGSFDMAALQSLQLDREAQGWIFWAFFIAFAIKMPIFPFHTWQPDTYAESPVSVTMLLSALMVKMAVYGVFRWILPVTPLAVEDWGNVVIILSVTGIIYASCIAIVQKSLRRLVAYASIAHVGLMAAGTFAFNSQGLQGAMFQMLSHGIGAVALFYVIEIIYEKTGTMEIVSLGGIMSKAPRLATIFLIFILSTVAMPLTNGFWGEVLLLLGVYKYSMVLGTISTLTIVLGAVYMLRMYQTSVLGKTSATTHNFEDITLQETLVLSVLVVVIFWMGVQPGIFIDVAKPAIENMLSTATQTVLN
jgi:NADH-quinone oxidoreductase subunit M